MALLAGLAAAEVGAPLPEGKEIMSRVLERATAQARAGGDRKYTYVKRSFVEDLDAGGKVAKTTDRTFLVLIIHGTEYDRLCRIGSRPLTESETKAEDRKEQAQRQRPKPQTGSGKDKSGEVTLTADLVGRFTYTVRGREMREGRPTLVIDFKPRRDVKRGKTVEDRVTSRLAGTLWIDEQEAEIARLKLVLTGELSLGWFGLVGSMTQCDMTFENRRLPDGGWVTVVETAELGGRKLLSAMHYRSREECSAFKPVAAEP